MTGHLRVELPRRHQAIQAFMAGDLAYYKAATRIIRIIRLLGLLGLLGLAHRTDYEMGC